MDFDEVIEMFGFSECAINLPDDECAVIRGKAEIDGDAVSCPWCGLHIGFLPELDPLGPG
jgi:hypothetical protein